MTENTECYLHSGEGAELGGSRLCSAAAQSRVGWGRPCGFEEGGGTAVFSVSAVQGPAGETAAAHSQTAERGQISLPIAGLGAALFLGI